MFAARNATRIAVIAAAACCARTSHASPDTDPTTGRAVFTGATLPAATSIILDPAALVLGRADWEFYAATTGTLDHISIDRKLLDLGTGALSAGPHVGAWTDSPGADLALTWHPSDGIALGVLFNTPPSQQFLTDQNALRYYTLGGYEREYQAAAAISFRVSSDLLIGVSIETDMTVLHLRYARDAALANGTGPGGVTSDCNGSPCGVENPAATERYDIHVYQHNPLGDGYVVNLGVMYQLKHDVWLAAAYHAPPGGETSVSNTLDGTADIIQAPRDGGAVLHSNASVYITEPVTVDAELRWRLPSALDLHIGGRWEDLSRNLGYDVRLYGSAIATNNLPIWTEQPRGFQDVLAMWGGVEEVDRGQRWLFGGRVGFETAALPDDRTTPVTISPTSGTLDLGAQLRFGSWSMQVSAGAQFFLPVSVTKSEFDPRDAVACVDGGYDYASAGCAALRAGYALPTAAGDYGRIEMSARLGFRYESL
jgi:hypothetical protein